MALMFAEFQDTLCTGNSWKPQIRHWLPHSFKRIKSDCWAPSASKFRCYRNTAVLSCSILGRSLLSFSHQWALSSSGDIFWTQTYPWNSRWSMGHSPAVSTVSTGECKGHSNHLNSLLHYYSFHSSHTVLTAASHSSAHGYSQAASTSAVLQLYSLASSSSKVEKKKKKDKLLVCMCLYIIRFT